MNHKMLFVFMFALLIFAPSSAAQNKPGQPDTTFGAGGRVFTYLKEGCIFRDAVLLPGDKFAVLCAHYDDKLGAFSQRLFRFNSDGALDVGFGSGGAADVPIDGMEILPGKPLKLLPDGKFLIGGTHRDDLALVRLNPDGSIDATFGVSGRVTADFADFEQISWDKFRELLIRPDGKLLVYGVSRVPIRAEEVCNFYTCPQTYFEQLILAQYNADGSPDFSFGVNGKQKSSVVNDRHFPSKAFFAPDGKLQIVGDFWERQWLSWQGWSWSTTHALVRYRADGNLDVDFGKDGIAKLNDYNEVYLPLPDDKVLAVRSCEVCELGNYTTRIRRYNSADLTVDAGFATNGTFLHLLKYIYDANFQPDGKFILMASATGFPPSPGVVGSILYRFNANGSVDLQFGNNGAAIFDIDGGSVYNSYPEKILFRSDGKILALGRLTGEGYVTKGIVVLRLIGSDGANLKSISRAR